MFHCQITKNILMATFVLLSLWANKSLDPAAYAALALDALLCSEKVTL